MKKILLLVVATLFAFALNAQVLFTEGFEGDDFAGWTLVDNDGDGNGWFLYPASTGSSHSGNHSAASASYMSGTALTPDNWLISPAITIPTSGYSLKWWSAAQDPDYPDDHYSVYVGTGNTVAALSATTAVYSETLSTDEWQEHTVDLSAYAGQTVYVAFRHHNSEDVFYMKIDDIEVSKPTTEPEIQLLGLTMPSVADANVNFNVTGTVKNTSGTALTSFDVTYNVNGGANVATYTVSGINVAFGQTYDFTHNVPVNLPAGTATITVTVSNPNGTPDVTTDNTASQTVAICGTISTFPFTEGFENGIGCWQTYTANEENNNNLFGVYEDAEASFVHAGTHMFTFTSYTSAANEDYTQMLISPTLAMSGAANLSFYARALSSYGTETFQIMTSTTGTNPTDFTAVGDVITATTDWVEYTAALPANTTHFAIKYLSEYEYYMGIDDISLTVASTIPEIELVSVNTPASVSGNENFNVTGTVKNNSAAPMTSFSVTYHLDNGADVAAYNVTGINVAFGATYDFTHNVPASFTTGGSHTVTVTVSNPNGTADNVADNTITKNIQCCEAITTFPYTEGFDDGLGCWTSVDADGDGYGWVDITELGLSAEQAYGETGSAISSASYLNASYTSLDPDNWLISPAIVVPATGTYAAKWYIKSQDGSYLDHYSAYVGTSSDISSFTTAVVSEDAPAEYTQNAIVLSQYAGQTIRIAFRHHNSSDNFVLVLDEFEVSQVASNGPEIALTNISVPSTVGTNTAFAINGTVKNNDISALTSFEVAYTIDGGTPVSSTVSGINVPYLQTYDFTVNATGIATTGNHTVVLTVSNPNNTADVTTDNSQTATVNVYDASASVPRKVLMENFTGASCGNCPSAHERIEAAMSGRNDVIWVSHHSGYNSDALTLPVDESMTTFYNDGGGTYAPAVMLDRTYWGDQSFTDNDPGPVFYPGSDMADAFNMAAAEPAFVTVNIAPSYNANNRTLSVTVSGQVKSELATTDARLNVWLMEDGLLADGGTGMGHGPRQSGASGTYYHNHVIRQVLNGDDWGEAGIVTNSPNSNYTKTYTANVSPNYDASKCWLVAFVSSGNHSNVNNCKVFNAEKTNYLTDQPDTPGGINDASASNVRLYPNPTTSNLYVEVEGLQKVEVIDLVGRVVLTQEHGSIVDMSTLANGIYTVRVMANGNTTVKKVVKK